MASGIKHFSRPPEAVEFVCNQSIQLAPGPDRVIWMPVESGIFSLSSALNSLRPKRVVQPLLRRVWRSDVPTKISIFFWRLI